MPEAVTVPSLMMMTSKFNTTTIVSDELLATIMRGTHSTHTDRHTHMHKHTVRHGLVY